MEDVRIDLSELQKYLELGFLDANSIKKREQAIRNGKTYTSIKASDYAEMQRRFDLHIKGFSNSLQTKNKDFTPRPKAVEVTSESKYGKVALLIACLVVCFYFILLAFPKTNPDTSPTPVDTAATGAEFHSSIDTTIDDTKPPEVPETTMSTADYEASSLKYDI